MHCPLAPQGLEAQSSMFVEQSAPVNPAEHMQAVHSELGVPPFIQLRVHAVSYQKSNSVQII